MDDAPTAKTPTTGRFSLRRWASRHAWIVIVAWLIGCAACVGAGALTTRVGGDLEGLLPPEHRAPSDRGFVLLYHAGDVAPDELLAVADRVHEVLGESWIPLAAPAAERAGWLDAHALYLLPTSTHEALAERLSDDNVRAAVESLRAQMSSPFFGLTMAESRRDPLGLRALTSSEGNRASWDAPPLASRAAPTPAGDLLAHDGKALLLEVRATRSLQALADRADEAVDERITVVAVGPEADEAAVAERSDAAFRRALLVALAGITLVLAVALRRVRQAASIVLCLGSGALACGLFLPLSPIAAPLAVLGLGFACEGALHLQRISDRGWPGALVLGTALLPLMLSPFALWSSWAPMWLAAMAVLLTTLRVVLPALQAVMRSKATWDPRGILMRPMPAVAVVLSVGLLAAGGWALGQLPYRGADRLELGARGPASALMHDTFFDPGLLAEATTEGETAEQALTRASSDARLLSTLVPTEARTIDTPGGLVLPANELQRRRVGLAELKLDDRLKKLRALLESRGFRPAAFGEFLRSASDPNQVPTPAAALEGPLGRWIGGYLETRDDVVALRARIHLAPDPDVVPPALEAADGRTLTVRGPAIGGRLQAAGFQDTLGIVVFAQLWLAAFVVWLGTRSLPVSIAAALAGLSTQTGMLAAMAYLEVPLSAALLPALLLGGASASIAAGRACRAIDAKTPLFATGLLVVSACQGVAGLALVASSIPLWTQIGTVAAVGAVLASGTGLFVAPGLAQLLRRSPKEAA